MAISKYINKTKDEKNKKINSIEIEVRHCDRSENTIEWHVCNNTKIKLQNYFHSKLVIIRNFQRDATISGEKCVKTSKINEMIEQEIGLLTQLTETF